MACCWIFSWARLVVFLHVHEDGADTGQPRGDKSGRKEKPGAAGDNGGHQEPLFDPPYGGDLFFQAERFYAFGGRIDIPVEILHHGVDPFRVFVGDADVVPVFSRVGDDGFLGPQVIAQGAFQYLHGTCWPAAICRFRGGPP